MKRMAKKTEALEVDIPLFKSRFVINGDHSDSVDFWGSQDLLGTVCKAYQGYKPRVCKNAEVSEKKGALRENIETNDFEIVSVE